MGQATASIDITGQQAEAVGKVRAWYRGEGAQVFRLFGYAGTGKTTLAQIIVDQLWSDRPLKGRALYAAYTGKAAYVLRTKGAANAGTIHSLIYTPVDRARDRLDELKKHLAETTDDDERKILQRRIYLEEAKLATPGFVLKEESELEVADLLVLDEVSMIGRQMADDLLSFGTKLLVLGDPAQLPPVDGGGYFIDAPANYLLTEIHRTALDSPVTRLATAVRTSTPGDPDLGVPTPDSDSGRRPLLRPEYFVEFDQVLAGTNRTRWQLIHQIRSMQGLIGPTPLPGDKVIVLANNAEARVFNGQMFTVAACRPDTDQPDILHMLAFDDEHQPHMLNVWACGFAGIEGEKLAKRNGRSRVVAATFGQAITCHKSQGSQWDRVLVVDESGVFAHITRKENANLGPAIADAEAHIAAQKWLYTAITRAAEQVVIVPGRR